MAPVPASRRPACLAGLPQHPGTEGPRPPAGPPPFSLSRPQLHPEPAWGVHAAAGLPEAPAGQQGALGGPAAAAAGAAAAGERGAQAAAAGRAPEAHRGAEGAAPAAGGGEGPPTPGPPQEPLSPGHVNYRASREVLGSLPCVGPQPTGSTHLNVQRGRRPERSYTGRTSLTWHRVAMGPWWDLTLVWSPHE